MSTSTSPTAISLPSGYKTQRFFRSKMRSLFKLISRSARGRMPLCTPQRQTHLANSQLAYRQRSRFYDTTRNFATCWACGEENGSHEGVVNFFCSNCGKIQDVMNIDGDEVSPFKVFGYSETFFVDTEDVEKRYWRLQKLLHPDKFAAADEGERDIAGRQSTLVNKSYENLKNPVLRGKILMTKTFGIEPLSDDAGTNNVPIELLAEVMEAREEIENLDSDDVEGASKIIRKTTAMVEDCSIQFQKALEIEKNVEVASEMLVRLQYLHKIEEETRRKCDHLISPSL